MRFYKKHWYKITKESTIENNINKSLNAIRIGELGYAKEYVNRILVEDPNHTLACQIRKYVTSLKQKSCDKRSTRIDFLISTLKEPNAYELFPLIELLCDEIRKDPLSTYDIERIVEQIETSALDNDVLKEFYNWLKSMYPIRKAEEEELDRVVDERVAREKNKKVVKWVIIILAIIVILILAK